MLLLTTLLLLPVLALSIPRYHNTTLIPRYHNTTLSIPHYHNTTLFPRSVDIPEPAPLDPVLVDRISCSPNPPKGYHDSHKQNVIFTAQNFCRNVPFLYSPYPRPMPPMQWGIFSQMAYPALRHADPESDVFNVYVKEIEGCSNGKLTVDMLHPEGFAEGMEEDTRLCESIIYA
ncbi:MAG: hypothetical protein Q9195_003341 [Heterodermia aff. obscurata]